MAIDYFQTFDFSLLDSPDFKEDSVRETMIAPLLYALGYGNSGLNQIFRSKSLTHPFVNIGSQKRAVKIIPDYLLAVESKYAWVLDAKAPNETILRGTNVEQAYSYAIHPEIRVPLFALCNGRELTAFRINEDRPVLDIPLREINCHWQAIYDLLAPSAFKPKPDYAKIARETVPFDYADIRPLPEIKNLQKQSAKRHFGVHPYFTKQVWNVVREYIQHYSQPGDTVLDPFGGSGVTAIEALMTGRKAIHLDINPLSIFLVKNLIAPVNFEPLGHAFQRIKQAFSVHAPRTDDEIADALARYPYPKHVKLPKNADVETVDQLFSPQQLAQLAYLKHLIKQERDETIQGTLLLMFSGLLNKINLTFHASEKRSPGQGDSAVFRYYRYRLAPNPALLDIMHYFELRLKKIIDAKKEIQPFISADTMKAAQIYQGSATALSSVQTQSIDYIYTDPPYGKKIQYLDLSIMWNSWLDLPVTEDDYALEAIEGGERNKTKSEYSDLLAHSIEEMYRVLKFDRWMSFVFAHKDPAYWHLIVETAEKAGFEYMGAVTQSNDKTSFKKQQHPFTVLSGQLIVNFRKAKNPQNIMKIELGADIANIVIETIEGAIAENDGATLEEINDELIIKGLELGFLDILSKQYQDVTPFLTTYFMYDDKTKKFHIPQKKTFKSRLDVRLRVRYFLLSYLRRMAHQGIFPTFDDIVLNIMPLLKNGITPEEQTILGILEQVAVMTGDGRWKLAKEQQINLL